MPAITDTTPKTLRVYQCHGVNLFIKPGSDEALGECPYCNKKAKFSVNIDEGTFRCFSCSVGIENGKADKGGNVWTFLRLLHQHSMEQTSWEDYEELAVDRSLLDPQTLVEWGVCKSITTQEWLIPGYNYQGKLMQLYRYVYHPSGRRHLHPTYGWVDQEQEIIGQLCGPQLFDDKKPETLLCEGAWDAMCLWETLRKVKKLPGGELVETDDESNSLLSHCNILAVPSCNTFHERWLPILAEKEVTLLYDSDHPRKVCKGCKKPYSLADNEACPICTPARNDGTLIPSPGFEGMKRASVMFGRAEDPPTKVSYLSWGADGYDPDRDHGWDLRDELTTESDDTKDSYIHRAQQWLNLQERIQPIPPQWATGTNDPNKKGVVLLQSKPCKSWKELQTAMRKAMHWGDGFDITFSFMLACICSVRVPEDQLWGLCISPPSTGKSSLCAALSVSRKWVYPRPHIRGVMSGYKSDKEGTEDFGLVPKIKDRTLLMKDADTLLKNPNLERILSELRDLYDGTTASHYLQGAGREYHNIRTSILLCGTEAMRALDDSELGQRFLTCRIMDDIDDEFEDEICTRAINRFRQSKSYESNGRPEEQQSKEMTLAMQLTGGYIDYLRKNMARLVEDIEISDHAAIKCKHLGKFVSHMRARPSKKQKEGQGREMSARLCLQLTKLATCMAVVMGKKEVDSEILRRVRKVALDTSRGRTLEICKELYEHGEEGVELRLLASNVNQKQEECRQYMAFLRERNVGVVDLAEYRGKPSRSHWKLTNRVRKLMKEIIVNFQKKEKV